MTTLSEIVTPNHHPLRKIAIVLGIVVVGFVTACWFHSTMSAPKDRYPFNTYLLDPHYRFSDLTDQLAVAAHRDPYFQPRGVESTYPPFTYVLLSLLSPCTLKTAILIFCLSGFALSQIAFMATAFRPGVLAFAVSILLLGLSYPLQFAIDRGNIELFTFGFLMAFLSLFVRKRFAWSALFLGLAIATKGHPALFLIVYFYEKKTRPYAALALAVALILSAGSLGLFHRGVLENVRGFEHGTHYFYVHYVESYSFRFNSSLLGACKAIAFLVTGDLRWIRALIHGYGAVATILTTAAVVASFRMTHSLWRRVAVITVAMILFNPVSFDYRLLHLFLPLALFFRENDESVTSQTLFAVLLGLLLIPKAYGEIFEDASMSSLLNPFLLSAMLAALIGIPEPAPAGKSL